MYWQINLAVLLPAALIAGACALLGARVRLAAAGLALIALVAATAVFDNLMIALGLFDYDRSTLLGWDIGLAPIEDFAYPLLAVILLPALWELFGRWSAADVRQVLRSSRPVSWVNTAYPFAAAYLLARGGAGSGAPFGAGVAGAGGSLIDAPLILGTLFFLLPYNLLMYGVNDVFDYESDLRNPRKGGIEGAVLERRLHRPVLLAAGIATVPGAIYLGAVGGPWGATVLALCLAGVIAYSVPPLRTKERPLLDCVTSSLHFVGPAAVGLTIAGAAWTPQLGALLLAFFLWGCGSHLFGAVQDVLADREAGIGSTATALGARTTARLSAGCYAAAGLAALGMGWPGALAALLVIPYLAVVLPSWRITDAGSAAANRGWRRFLLLNQFTGFAVTMLLILFAAGGAA